MTRSRRARPRKKSPQPANRIEGGAVSAAAAGVAKRSRTATASGLPATNGRYADRRVRFMGASPVVSARVEDGRWRDRQDNLLRSSILDPRSSVFEDQRPPPAAAKPPTEPEGP